MSVPTIASYFPFRRIKIFGQSVLSDASESRIQAQPDKRFQPICHGCGQKACGVHSWTDRTVRDLNIATARVWIRCRYRKLFCPRCQGIHIEDLELFHPYLRVTRRMAQYVYQLCRMLTVSDVARHLGLNWKTVKDIDKYYWFFSNLVGEEGSRNQGIKGASDSKRFYSDDVNIGDSSSLFLDRCKNIFL